ncbi:MAG TPA: hypothetical protein DCL41_06960 [Bdellovibrionales bacterium]|nr:hypothetical protein [Pseudobdellovibrionaceae bacterium]HAG91593.1 hypothetical protein [Bdellovibrionales bacterium]|tara:strand:+ start:312 stop:1058 length:747 start_codon:yes stop_codon:yes gene_type:complete
MKNETRFCLKHRMASLLAAIRGKQNLEVYRSLMFHSIFDSARFQKEDLYSLEQSKFESFLQDVKTLGLKVVRFEDSDRNSHSISLTFDDGYKDNLLRALPLLEKFNFPFTIFIVTDFLSSSYPEYLSEEEIRILAKHPLVTLGTHGKTHRPLADLDFEMAKLEIKESKEVLETLVGRPVETMSFPHGSYNEALVKCAKDLGYKKIGTSDPKPNGDGFGSLIFRQCIYSCDSKVSFGQKIRGKWDWVWS